MPHTIQGRPTDEKGRIIISGRLFDDLMVIQNEWETEGDYGNSQELLELMKEFTTESNSVTKQ